MPIFQYQGRNRIGNRVNGRVKATDRNEAVQKLKEDGVSVQSLEQLQGFLYKEIKLSPSKIKHKHFIIFLRQFSTLIKAGISINESTTILAKQTESKKLAQALEEISEDIREGNPFSQGAEKFPHIFPSLFNNMMKVGEASGQVDEILERLADYYETQFETRQKVKSALTYPVLLLFITITIFIFMLTVIVPKFTDMFASLNADLPKITLIILSISDFLKQYWIILFLFVAALIGAYIYLKRKPSMKYYFDMLKLKMPIFGNILQKDALARMTRTLGILYSATVPIIESLTIVQRVINNDVLTKVLEQSKDSLENGESMTIPLEGHWAFPSFVSRMIAVGEQSGSLDLMLEKIADFYESEVKHATDQLKSLIEPVLIIFVAFLVGIIVLSIMIPMLSIFQQIQ